MSESKRCASDKLVAKEKEKGPSWKLGDMMNVTRCASTRSSGLSLIDCTFLILVARPRFNEGMILISLFEKREQDRPQLGAKYNLS